MQDNYEDWTEAAATMADIYEQAFITIGAAWSNDSNGGCFSISSDFFWGRKINDTGLYTRAVSAEADNKVDEDWPLLQRGWV